MRNSSAAAGNVLSAGRRRPDVETRWKMTPAVDNVISTSRNLSSVKLTSQLSVNPHMLQLLSNTHRTETRVHTLATA